MLYWRAALPQYDDSANRFQEDVIATRLQLGDLLVQAKLVAIEDISKALQRQARHGGRLRHSRYNRVANCQLDGPHDLEIVNRAWKALAQALVRPD